MPVLDLQNSYIESNVPGNKGFGVLLTRNLEKYFKGSVKTELLREGPTQSGVSYPKYYAWVKIYQGQKLINEGAVRVEAIEKKRFEVTDFIGINDIKRNRMGIYNIFPALVCEKIKTHL